MSRRRVVVLPLLLSTIVFAVAVRGDEPESRVVLERRAAEAPAMTTNAVISELFATVGAIAPCSESEPNEQIAQASPLGYSSTCSGSVSATDASAMRIDYADGRDGIEDVYVLDLTAPSQPSIELTPISPSADLDLVLFALEGNHVNYIATSTHDQPGGTERIALTAPIPAGRYYVGVSAYSGSSPYTLTSNVVGASDTCTPNATTLCLNKGRFRVTADWRTSDRSGQGQGVLLTPDTGYFWFFGSDNVEVVVKVLDACSFNNRFWVFSGGLTDVGVTLKVTDTVTNATKEYTNPLSTPYRPITDTNALATCSGSCLFGVSPTSQTFSSSSGTGSVAVSANTGCNWSASSNQPWLTITSGSSGSGNGTVNYSVSSNTAATSRTATLTAAGQAVTITQSGSAASCTYSVSPTSPSFTAAAGTGTLSVSTQTGCNWTASTTTSWITITSGSSGTGNGTVEYSVAANTGTASRSGTITAAGRTVSVSQAGDTSQCTYTLEYTSKAFTWCGGDGALQLTTQSGCPFNVTQDTSWILPILISGRSSQTLSYQVASNTTGSARSGTFTVAGQTVTINQSAQSGGGQYDGMWTGTTAAGRSVSACVASGALQFLRISVRLDFPTFTCTTPMIRLGTTAISGSSFSGTISTYPEISSISTTMNGSFTSNTSMTGSHGSYGGSYFIICGSTLGLGTSSSILSSGTFTATKQP